MEKLSGPPPSAGALGFPDIPADLIAQTPHPERDACRLMALDRGKKSIEHKIFRDIADLISPGDLLVLNDTRVFPARLAGKKATGGKVQVLLLEKFAADPRRWTCLLTPSLKIGATIHFEGGLTAAVQGQKSGGEYIVVFSEDISGRLGRLGRMPLPPYIRRESAAPMAEIDKDYYQTVFAADKAALPAPGEESCAPGAVAAPTAGLHFTDGLLADIRRRGVNTVFVTLKVGWGTFRPISAPSYENHEMLPEEYEISMDAARAVAETRGRGKRVWAVGTTVVRTLEGAADGAGGVRPGAGRVNLFITPGFHFRVVDALVTNFHLPNYTPLLLAAAFAGTGFLRASYETAVRERYRFFSYGDAMVIQ